MPSCVSGLLVGLLLLGGSGQSPDTANFQLEVATLRAAPPATPKTLRIASFNVHYAAELLKLAEGLRQSKEVSQADIILIQEIEAYAQEGTSRTAKLAQALELNYVYAPARPTDTGGTHGLAILSRYPLRDIEVIRLPRFNTRPRIALAATVDVGATPLRIYNLHLDTRLNPGDRQKQLQPVAERARTDGVERVVVGGDFNMNPFRWLGNVFPIFRSDQAKSVDKFMRQQGFETALERAGPTSQRAFFRFRLDSVYTRGLKVRAAGVARDVTGSDHQPVWIEVAWP